MPPLPFTLGNEAAGTVVAVGPGVDDFKVGDEVHGVVGLIGAYAEHVAVKAAVLAHKPANLTMVEAAALPVAVSTSQAVISAGDVKQGTRILIHAASGGVGSVLVQLAKAAGAEVTALASPDNLDFVKGLGADHVVDRTTRYEDSIGDFDVVVDAFGPEATARSWTLLRKGGILIALASFPSQEEAEQHGVRAQLVFSDPKGTDLAAADALVEAGKLAVTIEQVYPFERASDAIAQVQAGKVRGKVVLSF
jgi:NADPH:quinone reductase-like Zn-dependent oxidoreductase